MTTAWTGLWIPSSTTDMNDMCVAAQQHFNEIHNEATTMAAWCRKVLPGIIEARGGSRRGLLGADAKLAAYSVSRPWMQLAALSNDGARLSIHAYARYKMKVVDVNRSAPAPKFDVDG